MAIPIFNPDGSVHLCFHWISTAGQEQPGIEITGRDICSDSETVAVPRFQERHPPLSEILDK
jgi:hypothetical protein